MSKSINFLPVTPNGFLELPKAGSTNQERSILLINVSEIALVDSKDANTEITLKNGKVVMTSATLEIVRQSMVKVQLQLKGLTIDVNRTPPGTKTKLLTWLAYQSNASSQLAKAIRNAEEELDIEYIEELTKDKFLKIKRIGKQTWFEFTELRGY